VRYNLIGPRFAYHYAKFKEKPADMAGFSALEFGGLTIPRLQLARHLIGAHRANSMGECLAFGGRYRYAADEIRTAAAEVGHHLWREAVARNVTSMTRTCWAYAATLLGDYLDIRGQQATRPNLCASDRYDASQKFGEEVRASGGAGLLCDTRVISPEPSYGTKTIHFNGLIF
jgi:hypothetical protein